MTQEEEEDLLVRTITECVPADVGFNSKMNGTAPIVRDWIKQEFGIQYSERGARQVLYRLGLSYTKPNMSVRFLR